MSGPMGEWQRVLVPQSVEETLPLEYFWGEHRRTYAEDKTILC